MIKRKHVLGMAATLALVLLIAIGAGILVLRSQAFHRYVLAKMVYEASHATGGKVEIGAFDFQWSGLKLDLYNVILHGTEPSVRPPLLRVDHLMVGLKIISLWRRKIDLNEIVVDHPAVALSVDENGHSNLPQPPPAKGGSSQTSIFDLAIGHFVLNQGQLDYNDRSIPLDGDVRDLHADVSYRLLKSSYDGQLGYSNGRVKFGTFNPLQHGLELQFSAAASGLTVNSLVLSASPSNVSLQAKLQNYANPTIEGSYWGDVSTAQLGQILQVDTMPAGMVNLKGSLRYQNHPNQPVLNNLETSGELYSSALDLKIPSASTTIRSVKGQFQLKDANLEARNVQGDVLGGRVSGGITISDIVNKATAKVTAAIRNVSLQATSAALEDQPLKGTSISGTLNGTVNGAWEGSGRNLEFRANATITGAAAAPGANSSAVPLQGELHLGYNGPTGVITVASSRLSTPHSSVQLNGSTGKQSSLQIEAQSDDLREVDQLILLARRSSSDGHRHPSASLEPLGISGSGAFTGQLRGSMANLQLSGKASSTGVKYRDAAVSQLSTNVTISPSGISLDQGEMRTAEGGQVNFSLSSALSDWTYKPQNPVKIELKATKISLATIQQTAKLSYPVSGFLGAQVSMHGTQSNLTGQGSVTLSQGEAWKQPIQNASVQFQGSGSTIHATLQWATSAGSGTGKVEYDFRAQSYDGQLRLTNLQLEQLELVKEKSLPLTGVLAATLQGKGTVKDPQLTAVVQAPKLQVGRQSFDGLKLTAALAHQKATFDLESKAAGASVQAKGDVALNSEYDADATVDLRNIQLGAVLPVVMPQVPPDLQGHTEVHAKLHGPLKHYLQLEGEVNIPALNLSYRNLQIGNASPIRAVYRAGEVTLQPCEFKGTGTDLKLQGIVPTDRARNIKATATGTVDLHLMQVIYPLWETSGRVDVEMAAAGTIAKPDLSGTVKLMNAAFQAPDEPLGAENVNAEVAVRNGRADIKKFDGQVGGGNVTMEGFATYQPSVQFNIVTTARKVRLRYPVGTRAILDGKLVLTGTGEASVLSGQVQATRLSLTKDFDVSTFADQFGAVSTPTSGPSFAQNVKLNVSLRSARDMALASSKLSVQGSMDLTVRGTAAEPVVLGRTDITGGEIFFNSNRFTIENGVVQFVNPVQTEPIVNIVVTTTVNQFNLTMNFIGPMDRLRTTYTSDPPLAPVDIINLLATGHATEAATSATPSPESVIAGQLTGQFSSRVAKLAGISSLTIDPQVGGAQGNGVGRLAIQQRVTKNLFFTFSTDLTTSTGQVVQVEYQVSKRFAVSTTRDQNGGYTVQVKLHKNF